VGKICPECGGEVFYVTGEFCNTVFINDEGDLSSVKEYEMDTVVKCRNCGREWSI
jgi:ribosomal protein L37E